MPAAVGAHPGHRCAGRAQPARQGRGAAVPEFDRRPYEYKVRNLEAQLAKAKQDVLIDELMWPSRCTSSRS